MLEFLWSIQKKKEEMFPRIHMGYANRQKKYADMEILSFEYNMEMMAEIKKNSTHHQMEAYAYFNLFRSNVFDDG